MKYPFMDDIKSYIGRIKKRRNTYYFLENVLLFIIYSYTVLIYLSFLDYYYPIAGIARVLFWVACLVSLLLFCTRYYLISIKSLEYITNHIQQNHPELKDNLLNALQIQENSSKYISYGMSGDLADRFLVNTLEQFKNIPFNRLINFKELWKFRCPLIALVLLSASFLYRIPDIYTDSMPKFIFPFSTLEFDKYVKVFPGDASIPLGTDVSITVSLIENKDYALNKPVLFIKTQNLNWQEKSLQYENNMFVSEKIHLISELQYYITWKGLRSKKYTLIPVPLPKLGDIRIKYYPPSYTGMGVKEGKAIGDTALLSGTRLEFTAVSNKLLKSAMLAISYGKKIPLIIVSGTRIKGEFIVEKEGECWFELNALDNIIDQSPAHYPLIVTKDKSPQITLLSPAQDLIAAQDAEINLIYRAEDDYGLSAVKLCYYIKNPEKQQEKNIDIRMFTEIKQEYTGEFGWKLSTLSLKPENIVVYYISVTDNDTISGPKTTYSEMYNIEIFNYEVEHQKVEEELKKFREDLLEVLGDEIALKDTLSKLMAEKTLPTAEQLKNMSEKQKEITKKTNTTNEKLQKTLDKMSNDPLTNYQIYQEHKYISESLDSLSKNQMPAASESLEKNEMPNAQTQMDDAIKNLEKMSLLAEDVLQYQKMNDLMNSGNKLNDLVEDLEKKLQSPEDAKNDALLNEALDKIGELMQEINDALKKLPQELPEEFINQPGVKDLDTQQMKNTADNIRDALSKKDTQKALKEAQNLLKQLQSMLKDMQKASNEVGFGSADKSMDEKVRKHAMELGFIINEQSELLSQTQDMEKIKQEKISKEQEKMLEKLAKKQREAINKLLQTRDISLKAENQVIYNTYRSYINDCPFLMEKVYMELSTKRVVKSKEYLAELLIKLKMSAGYLDNYSLKMSTESPLYKTHSEISQKTQDVKNIEQEILDTLNSETPVEFNDTEKKKMNDLAQKQSKLKERSVELDRNLQELSRQTAAVTSDISYNLRMAAHEMTNAQSNLNAAKTKDAVSNEQKALDFLTGSQDSMSSAQNGMGKMQSQFNKPMAIPIQMKSGAGKDGMMGVKPAPVKLPDVNEYMPAKEFREELIKALKEKYPQEYEQIIKQYYKNIAE